MPPLSSQIGILNAQAPEPAIRLLVPRRARAKRGSRPLGRCVRIPTTNRAERLSPVVQTMEPFINLQIEY